MLAGAPHFSNNKIPSEDIKLLRNTKRGKQLDDSVSIYSEFDDSIVRTELVQAQVHISRGKDSDIYSGVETESCACEDCPDCNNITAFKTKNIYHINEAEINNNNNNHNVRDRNREKNPPIIPIPPPPPMKDMPLPPPPQVRRGPPIPEPTPPPLPPKSRNSSAKSRMESESSLNIEKKRERKGKIAGDLNSDNESPTPTNTDSFQRRVARSQFRTVSPEPAEQYFDSVEDMRASQIYRHQLKNQKITHEELLLRVQSVNNNPNGGSGDNNEQQQNIDNLTLSFLKLGTSEMGDSGISSNLASLSTSGLSPKSDLTDASKDGAVDPADKIIPPGKKRDTMLRELKSKLKEKFPNNTLHNSKYNMGVKQSQEMEEQRPPKRPSDYAHRRKQNEISPGSTLAPVEESDSCDCDSLYECTYNSDGSAQVRSPPPNPPPTSASYRNQGSAATSGRTSAAGRSSRQSTEHSHRLGTPVDKPSHHNLRAGSITPEALLPARAESRSSIKRRQMRYAENNSPLPPRAATASPAKQRSAGYFRGSSRQLPRTPSGRRDNGSRSPDKRSHSSQDRNMKRPDSAKSKETNISGLSIQEKREMVYGPGGIYGPHGPFSTPQVSRYPEPIKKSNQKNSNNHSDGGHQEDNSLTSHGTNESSAVFEDRSDKSQYIANTVIKTPPAGSPDPHSASRLENYRTQVDASWKESKQSRMMSWITRTQQGSVAAK